MRNLLFVLTTALSAIALAAPSISGTISEEGKCIFLVAPGDPCEKYEIVSKNEGALSALVKLSSGDLITATGRKDPATCKVVIESVDYVGLRRMLGTWYSKDAVVNVPDFNLMTVTPNMIPAFVDRNAQDPSYGIQYRYSLVPADGKEWVMFLSDSRSTTFATIQFNRGSALMKIFDSDTGAIKKTFILYRKVTGI